MQLSRSVSLVDILVCSGIFLTSAVASVLAMCTPQVWNAGMVAALVGAVGGFGVVLGVFLVKLIFGGPSYVTSQGTMVYVGNTTMKQELLEKAVEHYIMGLAKSTFTPEPVIRYMMSKMTIMLSSKPVASIGKGYVITNKAGLAFGYTIGVCCETNKITGTAFFHELQHCYGENVLGKDRDYNHTDPTIWVACGNIERTWAE